MFICNELLNPNYEPIEHPVFKEFYYIPEIPDGLVYKYTLEIARLISGGRDLVLNRPSCIRGIHRYIALPDIKGINISINLQILYVLMFRRDEIDLNNAHRIIARYPKEMSNNKTYDPEDIVISYYECGSVVPTKVSGGIHTQIARTLHEDFINPNYKPIEHPAFKEFYYIPGFSNYLISPNTGEILSLIHPKHPRILSWGKNWKGYRSIGLVNDEGIRVTIFRHRLLATMFLRNNVDVTQLGRYIPNHINNIVGDDRLENLEWTTASGNVIHGFREHNRVISSVPVAIRNVDTEEVITFNSIAECADYLNYSSDMISYRINQPEIMVHPDRLQFRKGHSNDPWEVPDDIDDFLMRNSHTKTILVRNVVTNEVTTYPSNREASQDMGIGESTLSIWLDAIGQPLYLLPNNTFVQVKYGWDETKWRHVDNYLADYQRTPGRNTTMVMTKHEETGKVKLYLSVKDCAKDRGLLSTTLLWRLKSEGKKVYPDGYRYKYLDPNNPPDLHSVQIM